MNQQLDLDPLSSYEYPNYGSYPVYNPQYNYNAKPELPYYNQSTSNITSIQTDKHTTQNCNNNSTCNDEVKQEVAVVTKKKSKKNGQKSTYCSEKIADSSFPFYGCSVCNVSYTALHELDQHVTKHKNRLTSYRLRLRNQRKKKLIRKEKKKLKKMVKVKPELNVEVDIKPEDGYIGNETAAEYNNDNSENNGNTQYRMDCSYPNSENTNLLKSDINSESSQFNGNYSNFNDSSLTNTQSNKTRLTNTDDSMSNGNSENNGNDLKAKEKSMNEKELDNLEKIYKCFACQKQFSLSYYLKLHVRSHTDEKPYTCTVCGQSFITASKLGRHNKRIHLAARFQCRICFKIFSRFELLTAHFDKQHPEDKLEGEPYDYNAILPYLKELEEQLREQAEAKEKCSTDEPWPSSEPAAVDVPIADTPEVKADTAPVNCGYGFVSDDKNDVTTTVNTELESVDVKVKSEVSDDGGDDRGDGGDDIGDGGDDHQADDAGDVKDENSSSDEDYFPSNTWTAPPTIDPEPIKKRKAPKICDICHKEVSSASYMRVHLRTHTGEKPFKCYKCGRGFITKSKMHRHMMTHEDNEGVVIKSEDPDVKSEAENNDNADEISTKSKKKRKLKKKNNDAVPTKRYQKRPHACEYCNQKFLHLNMLEIHKKSHEGETLIHRCHYCLEVFPDAEAVKRHETTHTGPKPYLCTICGKGYKKRETMVYHKKYHKPEKEFICDICSKRFNAYCKLQKHIITHRADKFVLRYECPVCAHMFNTKYHIQMHLATHQKEGLIMEENRNEILAMVLQNARKIPKNADAPPNLTDIIPSDERSRVCNICGEVFHHFFYLEEHLKSHGSKIALNDDIKEEERKHICPICSKGFKLHYYLKLHSFTHSKEKPYVCQQCGKGFITKGKLKRHMETHSGLKKYQCHICYKFFTRPSYLRIHIRTIHGTHDNFAFDKNYLNMQSMGRMSIGTENSV